MKKIYIIVIFFILLILATSSNAELQIEIDIDSTMLFRGDTQIEIPVYLSNFTDTIAGFNLWFQLDRPDIALFQMYEDSGIFKVTIDTTGSILPSGGYLEGRSFSGFGSDVIMAWNSKTPALENSLLPQVGGKLFTLILEPVPGFPSSTDCTILLTASSFGIPLENVFSITSINGNLIGLSYRTDTTYYDCDVMCGPVCCSYIEVEGPLADSISVDTAFSSGYNDTNIVKITNGIITTTCCDSPGDFNGSGSADIADLTYLVNYMFKSGPAPFCLSSADVNNDCSLDVKDLTYNVLFMFSSIWPRPQPYCGCID